MAAGRATQNLQEACRDQLVDAQTVHRMLGYKPMGERLQSGKRELEDPELDLQRELCSLCNLARSITQAPSTCLCTACWDTSLWGLSVSWRSLSWSCSVSQNHNLFLCTLHAPACPLEMCRCTALWATSP